MIIKNPVTEGKRRSSDPFAVYYEGVYYSCYADGDGVYVSFCDSLDLLGSATEITVWKNELDRPIYWYAPEMHKIDNKWYIYGAPGGWEDYPRHTMSVLESVSDDPKGPYVHKGIVKGLENKNAIDGTILEHDGKRYMVWSDSNLLIAEMSDPFAIKGEISLLARPERPYETVMCGIVEGPCVIRKDGRLHIIYAASDSRSDDYCLALLTYKGGDVLDASNWEKSDGPVFSKTEGIYGPGHCSVTVAEKDGKTVDVLLYHANLESGSGWNGRSVWVKPFTWDNGYPVFGKPERIVEI
jgi:GH43 family beta-xylosidase